MGSRTVIGSETGDKKVTLTDAGSKTLLETTLSNSSGTNAVDILVNGNKPLTVRVSTGATYEYTGMADPGSATSSALWKILRETIADGTLLYADGNGNFDNVWDNFASLSYS